MNVTLLDGSIKEVDQGATARDVAKAIGSGLARAALAATINEKVVDLTAIVSNGDVVGIVTANSDAGREILRHSTSHVMAQAVTRLWPGAQFAIGPVIANGFYYDFFLPDGARFRDEDLGRIEDEMKKIISEAQPFVRHLTSADEALKIFANQPYKCEIIAAVRKGTADKETALEAEATSDVVSIYENANGWVDLCRGPHVPSTKHLGHFRLQRVAGAYWRGDEKRPQLQRIYGTAWESKDALLEHLHFIEEAERRDHRVLGADLDLFSFPEEIGSGLAVFHPKGGIVRKIMEDYSRLRHEQGGYEFVYSPHITKADLFETSGHLDFFEEGMFPPMELDGGAKYYLKPMNCPFHILIYRSRQRSYRELPVRLFEFGTVYRYEKSGVVQGLTRTRGLTQDDAHIFCTKEQMAGELDSLLTFVLDVLSDYGLSDFYLELSTRPSGKAVGSQAEWDEATLALEKAALSRDLELVIDEGGGAFYGPKISVQARDAIGRTWQMSTLQLDFQEPQRFKISYVSAENEKETPVMIHRALFGSVERFFAVLLEHYGGALPVWLAPEQVRVFAVRDDFEKYAKDVSRKLRDAGFRASDESATEPLGTRIRRAKLAKVPYILVVGADDLDSQTVGVNVRGHDNPERGVALQSFIERLAHDVETRRSDS